MFESYLIYIIFSTLALIGITVPFVAISTIKHIKKQNSGIEEKFSNIEYQVSNVIASLESIKKTVMLPVEKLDEIERRSRRITERLEQLELREQSQRQYEHAISLIKRGSSVDEVMQACSLNRGEVELISVMHEIDQNTNIAN